MKTRFPIWFDEYQDGVRYGLKGKLVIEETSKYQKITIIESERYGKALLLDNRWMLAEHLERQYHECLVHPALSTSKEIKNILIIGGGDGGTARECLLYKEVENIDLIEIDQRVVEICQQHLPKLGGSAWKDPRLHLKIEDGINWVINSIDNLYDVILVDSTDPDGPAKGLFNKRFFSNCKRILKADGVLAIQTESPEAFEEIHIEIVKTIREVFEYADPLYGSVPIYPSGLWSWTFASKEKPIYLYPNLKRVLKITQGCSIWSPRWQKGSFDAIPALIERKLGRRA